MANTYKLTINDIPKENLNLGLTYNQDDGSTQTLSINNTNYKCTLNKFSYKKAIYQPGEIHIELQVGKESNAAISFSEVEDIHNAFIGKFFQLQYTGKKTLNIAEDYYSFDVKIEKQGSGKPLTVQIQTFDPLKFLALDKYCMAYTCKKLIKDILINSAVWPNGIPKKLTDKLNSAQTTTEKIDKLKYDIYILNKEINDLKGKKQDATSKEEDVEKKIKDVQAKEKESFIITNPIFLAYTNNTDKTYTEFIQPYLVQYNESLLDFLIRVTNRCGEFFYYEGGKIHIGWKATDPIIIQEYVSVKFPQEVHTAWEKENSIADIHNDYTQGTNLINSDSPKVMRDSELAFDENLVKIPPKEEYTSWQDFALFPGCFGINVATEIFNSANLAEAILNVGINLSATFSSSTTSANATNDDYEEKNFKNGNYKDERQNEKCIHPFSTSEGNKNKLESYVTFSLKFYEAVRKGIEENEQSRIQIVLDTHFYPLLLGSQIKLDNNKKYIVVQINGCINNDTETLSIEAIPFFENEKKNVFPPVAPVSLIREAKAQRAFITHNVDPLKMNRVRVRYPWQGKTEKVDDLKTSEDSTPWIRIALPMASNSSGFNFLPQIGDEAIINYENGNIEKPYVEGMLYTREKSVPYDFKRDKARVISSVNGHSIIFSDPSANTNAFNGISPAWKTLSSFAPTVFNDDLSDDYKKAMGGIEFTDEHGLYSISMSSDKRAISIDSPLGKVDINAFTGITISAPNGNIKIEGKNISIAAGNNLTISSGNNINTNFWLYSNPWKEMGKDCALTFLKRFMPIDMMLIRTMLETFLRPIGGTMLIKSNRYMCLEAGEGTAKIIGRNYTKQRWNRNSKLKTFLKGSFAHKSFNTLSEFKFDHIYNIVHGILSFIYVICSKVFNVSKSIIRHQRDYADAYLALKNIPRHDNKYTGELKTADEIISDAINELGYTSIRVNDFGQDDRFLVEAINELNDYGNALYTIVKEENETKVWNRYINILPDEIKEIANDVTIKSKIQKVYEEINWYHDHLIFLPNTFNAPKAKIREALYFTLIKAIEMHKGDDYNISVESNFSEFNDDYKWDILIDKIAFVEQSQKVIGENFVLDLYNLKDMADQYVWDKTENGEILFSNEKGKTLHFTNNGITNYEQIYDAKVYLAGLKKLLQV